MPDMTLATVAAESDSASVFDIAAAERAAAEEQDSDRIPIRDWEQPAAVEAAFSSPAANGHALDAEWIAAKTEPGTALDWVNLQSRGSPPARRWAIHGWLGFFINLIIGSGA